VESLVKPDRSGALAAAAAHAFNNELTVILTSLANTIRALEPGHPARRYLRDMEGAALRCAWRASRLLDYGARHGARAVRGGMDGLLGA
jgi:hypothetical protein